MYVVKAVFSTSATLISAISITSGHPFLYVQLAVLLIMYFIKDYPNFWPSLEIPDPCVHAQQLLQHLSKNSKFSTSVVRALKKTLILTYQIIFLKLDKIFRFSKRNS